MEIIHLWIVSRDIYREVVVLSAAKKLALKTLGIWKLSDPFLNVVRKAYVWHIHRTNPKTFDRKLNSLCGCMCATWPHWDNMENIMFSYVSRALAHMWPRQKLHDSWNWASLWPSIAHMMSSFYTSPTCILCQRHGWKLQWLRPILIQDFEHKGKGQLSLVSWF